MGKDNLADVRADAKKQIDDQIRATGGAVDINNETYLKKLIELGSQGKQKVSDTARGLQFFIVRGGSGGPSRIVRGGGVTTSGRPESDETTMVFDDSDFIVVFDAKGKLISSALLSRPITIWDQGKLIWSESTANKVYAAWDGRPVSLYHNRNFTVKYFGLMVDDSKGFYKSGQVRIDMHKQEATNGCMFILDSKTPAYSEDRTDLLSAFEPKFIKDIQVATGHSTGWNIGVIHMVELRSPLP